MKFESLVTKKRVFFSFHYQDVADFRANVVRNSWLTKPNRDVAGFYDASIWESAKKTGSMAIKRLINQGIRNTSNTCVLVGSETYSRPWVRYEILKSFVKGNHIFAVGINGIKGRDGRMKSKGLNPLHFVGVSYALDGKSYTLHQKINGKWFMYREIDGKATFPCNAPIHRRGNKYLLNYFYETYDWVDDEGYRNFSKWVT